MHARRNLFFVDFFFCCFALGCDFLNRRNAVKTWACSSVAHHAWSVSLRLDWFNLKCSFYRPIHCAKDHPKLLPYFHICAKLIRSPTPACGFARHQSRTSVRQISRTGRNAQRSSERADVPRKTSALYFPCTSGTK